MDRPSGAIEVLIRPRPRDLGGFTVRRSLPHSTRQRVGPFIFFDHMGPAEFPPGGGVNVRPHPHIGLATVTYLFDGEIVHHDSLGFKQHITPGAVNWMTAGRGIVHSERTPPGQLATGSRLHGIQTWVALPLEQEECEPHFEHYPADGIPIAALDGAEARVILGNAFGAASPVATASETLYVELSLQPGAVVAVPESCDEIAVYVVTGGVRVGDAPLDEGCLAVLGPDTAATLSAPDGARVMLLGGATLAGERIIWWNFVNSSVERMERAKRDWKAGRFAMVPDEHDFIPLPES